MALIKCPECGKENVSDTALACPNCGYAIKKHFNRSTYEQKRLEAYQKAEQKKIAAKQKRIETEKKALNSVPMPEKPIFSRGFIIYSSIVIALIILPILSNLTHLRYHDIGSVIFTQLILLLIVVGLPSIYYYRKYKTKLDEYNLAQTDLISYQRMILERQRTDSEYETEKSYLFHKIVSFLIPLVGLILGAILLSKDNDDTCEEGKMCIILSIISSIIATFIIYVTIKR